MPGQALQKALICSRVQISAHRADVIFGRFSLFRHRECPTKLLVPRLTRPDKKADNDSEECEKKSHHLTKANHRL